ncbi:hypothetical protein J3E71DRAFT_297683, partial [Bipolaris maydis]
MTGVWSLVSYHTFFFLPFCFVFYHCRHTQAFRVAVTVDFSTFFICLVMRLGTTKTSLSPGCLFSRLFSRVLSVTSVC